MRLRKYRVAVFRSKQRYSCESPSLLLLAKNLAAQGFWTTPVIKTKWWDFSIPPFSLLERAVRFRELQIVVTMIVDN
jgi:hypothetical protein